MNPVSRSLHTAVAVALLTAMTGCCAQCLKYSNKYTVRTPIDLPSPPVPVGSSVDSFFKQQEANAEASDFVIYEHEFDNASIRLAPSGEDHVRQIAARAAAVSFPVVVEKSASSPKPGSRHGFPVHNDPELDMQRRLLVVKALTLMGVPNADSRVVVAPAITAPYSQYEAEAAYQSGMRSFGGGGGGYGGGIGGGGGGYASGGFF